MAKKPAETLKTLMVHICENSFSYLSNEFRSDSGYVKLVKRKFSRFAIDGEKVNILSREPTLPDRFFGKESGNPMWQHKRTM